MHAPALLAFDVSINKAHLNRQVNLRINGRPLVYQLQAVIYHGNRHFTSRIITTTGVWFHDGISGPNMVFEGNVTDLSVCREMSSCVAIYTTLLH